MKKAFGRSLDDFLPLRDAENKLLHACASGTDLALSHGRPEQKTPENALRAEFVRFLALGGDESAAIHEMGVQVEGAWIEGSLNLDHCTVRRIWLGKCRIPDDCIDSKRYPLFMARDVMRVLIEQLQAEGATPS